MEYQIFIALMHQPMLVTIPADSAIRPNSNVAHSVQGEGKETSKSEKFSMHFLRTEILDGFFVDLTIINSKISFGKKTLPDIDGKFSALFSAVPRCILLPLVDVKMLYPLIVF